MKSLTLFVYLSIATINISVAQNIGAIQKIDNHISVKFPNSIDILVPGSFSAIAMDSVICSALAIDFSEKGIDSTQMKKMIDNPQFIKTLKTIVISDEIFTDIQDFSQGNWQGLTSYTTQAIDKQKKKNYFFIIIRNSTVYAFITTEPDDSNGNTRKSFFKSIQLTH